MGEYGPGPGDTAGVRGNCGVVATIRVTEDGRVRLILDDVIGFPMTDAQGWKKERLYTYKDFEKGSFLLNELDESDLADIGLQVVARLTAALSTSNEQSF